MGRWYGSGYSPVMNLATASINGIDIAFTDSGGAGPAVLLSHGFLMDHTMFDAQVAALGADYRCIGWDERGFGATPAPGPFTYWDSADDAVALLDHLGIDQAVFVGMSQGGFLSLRAALAHPTRVRAVVLIDSAADTDSPETLAGYGAMMAALTSVDDATFDPVAAGVADLILGDPTLIAEWVPKWKARRSTHDLSIPGDTLLARDDISARMGEIACPLLVVHGSADAAITLDRAQAVAAAVQDCRGVVVVDGGAHAPNMSHPGQVNDALLAFLAGL